MNDDIKEILDNIKKCCEIMQDENFVVYQKQDIIKLLDYITNLQEQLHQASLDIQELTERDIECPSWCDKLTNLQQENKKLEDTLTRITASDGETTTPVLDLIKENERLKEENKYLDELRNANYLSWQDSLSRIEKAVEYKHFWQNIEENGTIVFDNNKLMDFFNKMEKILNGRSDE